MVAEIRAFQIFYDARTRAMVDPDFEPLDNSASERPDWYEYWPIRDTLREGRLDESAYYGFLSPEFFDKTRLTGRRVKDFIRQADGADVITFSPWPCHAACFLNVFEHNDSFCRGLFELSSRFYREIDPGVRLETLVMHSRNTIYSNYFFAKPRFWRRWTEILERMLGLAEERTSPLYPPLNQPLKYSKGDGSEKAAAPKIFVLEGAASYLLASGSFVTRNFPPFEMPVSEPFVGRMPLIVMLDALKIAYAQTRDPYFLRLFKEERAPVATTLLPGYLPPLL
jgi:hypothetical protein